jgi:hypothetical protein
MQDYATFERTALDLSDHTVSKFMLPIYYAVSSGEPIEGVAIRSDVGDGELVITFRSGTLRIWDNARSCCENRYMSTDDELDTFVGARLVGLEAVDGPNVESEYGDPHEQVFVKVETTAGTITLVTHNEHNGYYGGFDILSSWNAA